MIQTMMDVQGTINIAAVLGIFIGMLLCYVIVDQAIISAKIKKARRKAFLFAFKNKDDITLMKKYWRMEE